jgi:hypothetical protein
VQLANSEEIHHLSVKIIQYLYLGLGLAEKNLCSATEGLTINFVDREERDDFRRNCSLASDIGQRSYHV